ncbi:hypothetical protein GLYMA_20G157400v4 [Glycine max]|uniref:Uncharacterized protein n=1 Tax=Glycine max TaxID=3847 RepID=A0A0R0EKF0_SOYBN|nr:hypothetical protein GYH30_056002 [Glycine max]KRG91474.1 hypothetical protein GLYMA_20G157400v4 [Glycine max]
MVQNQFFSIPKQSSKQVLNNTRGILSSLPQEEQKNNIKEPHAKKKKKTDLHKNKSNSKVSYRLID